MGDHHQVILGGNKKGQQLLFDDGVDNRTWPHQGSTGKTHHPAAPCRILFRAWEFRSSRQM